MNAVILALILMVSSSLLFPTMLQDQSDSNDKSSTSTADHALERCPAHPLKKDNLEHDAAFPVPFDGSRAGTSRGEYSLLCIRVQFQVDNVTTTTGNGTMYPNHNLNHFNSIFDRMAAYYLENSYGQFILDAHVTEKVYTLDHEMSYYGANDNTVERNVHLVNDAIEKADDDVDFRQFGKFIIIHAGSGEETDINGDSPNDIWSNHIGRYHMWAVLGGVIATDDGTLIGECSIVPETQNQDGYIGSNITGVVCHEFGHDLGLPDLYDVDYTSDGIGVWGIMGAGAHLNGGLSPAHFSAWSKIKLGWVTPTVIYSNTDALYIRNIEIHAEIYKIVLPNTNGNEYFLLENRARFGFDAYLPHGGLLIWHVDETVLYEGVGGGFTRLDANIVNTNPSHKGVDLEEASGRQDLDVRNDYNNGDGNDPWYRKDEGFTPHSTPDSRDYSGRNSEIYIHDISSQSNNMSFSLILEERKVFFYGPDINSTTKLPGTTATFELELVSNREGSGDITDQITLTPSGENHEWMTLSQNPVTIHGKNQPTVVFANVTVPPDSLYLDKALISIFATSSDSTEAIMVVNLTVKAGKITGHKIDPIGDIALLPGPENGKNVTVWLNNTGNSPEEFEISVPSISDKDWEVLLYVNGLSIEPDDESYVYVEPYSLSQVYVHINSPPESPVDERCTVNVKMTFGSTKVTRLFNATVLQAYNISISPDKLESTAKPRTPLKITLTLNNYGNGEDNISLTLTSKKAGWDISLTNSFLIIGRGESSTAKVIIYPYKLASPGDEYTFTVTAISLSGMEVETETILVTVEEYDGMSVEIANFNATIEAGKSTVNYNIKVSNEGSSNDVYTLSTMDRPAGFSTSMTNVVGDGIEIEAYGIKFVVFQVKMLEAKKVGTYPVVIEIESGRNSTLRYTFTFNITVAPAYGIEVRADDEQKKMTEKGKIVLYLYVNNTSNTNITVEMIPMEVPSGIHIEVEPKDYLSMDIRDTGTFAITLTALSNLKKGLKEIQFNVVIRESGKTEELITTLRVVSSSDPPSPDGDETASSMGTARWILIIVIPLLVVIGIVIAVIIFLVKRKKNRGGDMDILTSPHGPSPEETMISPDGSVEVLDEFEVEVEELDRGSEDSLMSLPSLQPAEDREDPTLEENVIKEYPNPEKTIPLTIATGNGPVELEDAAPPTKRTVRVVKMVRKS